MTNDKIDLSDAYALETPEDSINLYKKWAQTYDKDFALNWAKENNKDQKFESIVKDDDFNKLMKEVVNRVNKNLSVIEQVRKFILIDHEFTIENSMMTVSMKVRRFAVKDKYQEDLEKLY